MPERLKKKETPPERKEDSAEVARLVPEKTIRFAVPAKAVKTEARKAKLEVSGRVIAREGGGAAEAGLSYGPFGVAGGALYFMGNDTGPFARLNVHLEKKWGHVALRYAGGVSYTGVSQGILYTAHHFGAAAKAELGSVKIRISAGLTPSYSYRPAFLEAEWGVGASAEFAGKLMPYAIVGGRLAPSTPVHLGSDIAGYLVPRYEATVAGIQYRFGRGSARVEAEITPFHAGGAAGFSWHADGWALSAMAGARRWHGELFSGRAEPVFGISFSGQFGAGNVRKVIRAEAEGSPLALALEPKRGKDYSIYSWDEVLKSPPEKIKNMNEMAWYLYSNPVALDRDLGHDVSHYATEVSSQIRAQFNAFLSALESGAGMGALASSLSGRSAFQKIRAASLMAELMRELNYASGYMTISGPPGAGEKGADSFLRDLRDGIRLYSLDYLHNPTMVCAEIHHTATVLLNRAGVKAFSIGGIATEGDKPHAVTVAIGEKGLHLIDYGKIYATDRFDLGMLLRGYARENGKVLLGSYIFTDTNYLGTYTTPEGKLIKGVLGVNHWKEMADSLGVER